MNKPTTAVSKTVSWIAKRGLGYLIGIACLIWVFHDVQRARILEHLRGVRWAWVASAVLAFLAAIAISTMRPIWA